MISRSKIAKKLKRDINENLYLLSVRDCEEYRLKILNALNEFADRWEIERNQLRFLIDLTEDSLNLTYNRSGQFDRFLKAEKLVYSDDQHKRFNKVSIAFDNILFDYLKQHPTKTKGTPYFSYDIFDDLMKRAESIRLFY